MSRRYARKKRARASSLVSLGNEPARRGGAWVALVLGALVLVNLYVFVWDKKTSISEIKRRAEGEPPPQPPPAVLPTTPLAPAEQPSLPGAPASSAPAPVGPPGVVDG